MSGGLEWPTKALPKTNTGLCLIDSSTPLVCICQNCMRFYASSLYTAFNDFHVRYGSQGQGKVKVVESSSAFLAIPDFQSGV